MDSVKIGLAGAGTVGGGVCRVLNRNQEQISARAGARIEVKYVTCRHPENRSDLVPLVGSLGIDWHEIVEDPEIAIAVEAMGGIEPARSYILAAIEAGKHVVTANKALLAQHGDEIFDAAAKKGVIVAFEASVAGGIPIIKAMRESLVANRIQSVVGIINGTSATTYAPNDTLTWAAALKLLLVSNGNLKAADATGADWSKNAIAKAAELGLVAADLDGAKAISRLEFCQVAAKLNKLAESKTESKFTDCADGYVMALVDAKVIDGMTATTFEPDASLTRAQIAKIIYQLNLIEK